MKILTESVITTIYGAIDEINKMLPEEERLEKLPRTSLAGDKGRLDSLGTINFIVEVESRVKKNFGLALNLIEALEMPEEPMKNIGQLAIFIVAQSNRETV
jgi:acyl carrier protein